MIRYALAFILMGTSCHAFGNILPYDPPQGQAILTLQQDAVRLMESPPRTLDNETDLACIAVTVYHESRGESVEGQKAVASVVIQRSLVPNRWGSTPCAVVQPVQFSYLTADRQYARITDMTSWQLAVRVALTVMLQGPDPELMGADHYHTHQVTPTWRLSMDTAKIIGNHIFYVDPDSSKENYTSPMMANIPWTEAPATAPNTAYVQTQDVAVYDWSGSGVPQQTTQTVAYAPQAFEAVPLEPQIHTFGEPQVLVEAQPRATGGFSPVRGPDVQEIRTAQNTEPMVVGIAPTNSLASNGMRLGINLNAKPTQATP